MPASRATAMMMVSTKNSLKVLRLKYEGDKGQAARRTIAKVNFGLLSMIGLYYEPGRDTSQRLNSAQGRTATTARYENSPPPSLVKRGQALRYCPKKGPEE
jgi:hypothetical protein